ncbi:MAG TPA: UPF0758 domain-containing protein, partial [Pedobacter sp.]|nr:UPF0758 domain-containing protein [Pedobacter sp.]
MKTPALESESFSSGNRNYFIDFKRAASNNNYIKITRSDRLADGTFKKSSVVVFEDDFHFFIESFSMLFTSIAHKKESGEPYCSGGIKSWDPEERPREKLLASGSQALSEAELLAILIGAGTRGETAVGLAERILKSVNNDLAAFSELSVAQLTSFNGIGEAKAISIIAAM